MSPVDVRQVTANFSVHFGNFVLRSSAVVIMFRTMISSKLFAVKCCLSVRTPGVCWENGERIGSSTLVTVSSQIWRTCCVPYAEVSRGVLSLLLGKEESHIGDGRRIGCRCNNKLDGWLRRCCAACYIAGTDCLDKTHIVAERVLGGSETPMAEENLAVAGYGMLSRSTTVHNI